jgi:thiamine biosynthesis lipoprotein
MAGLAAVAPALLLAAASATEHAVVADSRPFAGSMATVTIVAPADAPVQGALDAAFAELSRVDEVMNEWRPESPLSRLNAAAGTGAWTPLPADLCGVLRAALRGAERTGGLFDPTWAALRSLWRFEPGATPPDDEALSRRCALVDWRKLQLRADARGGCRARLPRPGMAVGLGGIAKGWAVDAAVAALRRRGHSSFVVQAGGDLYAAGSRGEVPWMVGIRDPRGPVGSRFAELAVRDRAFSTSGDYEHAFEAGGKRYHHVLDPRTCRPAPASRSVTILARTAVEAEILGKAAFITGGEEGLALVRRAGAAAVIVTAGNRVLVSPSLRARLRLVHEPSPGP